MDRPTEHAERIPYRELETLFLDAGNTLVSMDFVWIATLLTERGVACDAEQVRRAEAAARPGLSALVEELPVADGHDYFPPYMSELLRSLVRAGVVDDLDEAALVADLAPILRMPGGTPRLWSYRLPGVLDALQGFRELGLQLVVVSNSDGTARQSLAEQDVLPHLDLVIDSFEVGFEKPDPRIFEHALGVAGARAETTLHVGDLYSADVVGARRSGVHALLLDPFDDWRDTDCARLPDLTALHDEIALSRRNR